MFTGRPKATKPSAAAGAQPPQEAQPPPLAAVSASWSPMLPAEAADSGSTAAADADGSTGCARGGGAEGSAAAADGSADGGGGAAAGSSGGAAALLAVGTAGGLVWLWRLQLPAAYTLQQTPGTQIELVSWPAIRIGSAHRGRVQTYTPL